MRISGCQFFFLLIVTVANYFCLRTVCLYHQTQYLRRYYLYGAFVFLNDISTGLVFFQFLWIFFFTNRFHNLKHLMLRCTSFLSYVFLTSIVSLIVGKIKTKISIRQTLACSMLGGGAVS